MADARGRYTPTRGRLCFTPENDIPIFPLGVAFRTTKDIGLLVKFRLIFPFDDHWDIYDNRERELEEACIADT